MSGGESFRRAVADVHLLAIEFPPEEFFLMSFQSVNPTGAHDLLQSDKDFIVVDVRTVEEFDEGHVPGSYNVPIAFSGAMGMSPKPTFSDVIQRHFQKDQKIVFA